jgi:hypothetical protein
MKHTSRRTRVAIVLAVLTVSVAATRVHAGRGINIRQDLSVTGVDPDARGQVQAQISSLKSGMRAKLDVRGRRLDPKATYVVLLDGVRIGTLTTTARGSGQARFTSQPRRKDQLLGVDPRGMQIEVRNAAGDGVLETHVPDDTIDPTHIRCCVAHGDDANEAPECEDVTADACTAAGGTNLGAGSCLPNPCETGTPPPPQDHIVCCTPEDDTPECEMRSAGSCSEHHGVNLGAGSCDPNPCASTAPPTPATVRCCLTDDHETECEHRTAERCAAQGGTDMGAGSCSPNPCVSQPPPDQVRCCLPKDSGGTECEQRTADQCTAHGGSNVGAGTCDANACGTSPTPTSDKIRCCLPHNGDHDNESPECEQLTAEQCAAHGGMSLDAGSCDPNPCQ